VSSRLQMSGLDPEEHLIVLEPDEGELFSAAHVCETIAQNADTLAMVILPGVQYYTGQVLAMKEIAAAARKHEIVVGLDLAHAVGNVELALHDWDVDFAVWCTYKYLNSGPGAVAGCFVHERHAFPSDSYAVSSRLQMSGLDPKENLIVLEPDDGELFSAAHVCDTIRKNADTLAMVILPGVQYYTGQVLAMKQIAAVAREHEIVVGLDLAHAVGNVELALHDWDVDFAVWCTYKYLNSGPGAVAGCFVHERHANNTDLK